MVRQVLAFDEENPTPAHRLAYACAEDPAHAPPPTLLEDEGAPPVSVVRDLQRWK